MPASPRRRGPYAKTPARREEILTRAVEAFSARGYYGSSLREVAAAVGLSQAGLLHHFASKEELLAAVLSHRDQTSRNHFLQAGEASLVAGLRAVVVHNLTQRELVRLFTTLAAEASNPAHPAHGYFQARYVGTRALIAEAVLQGQRDGQVSPTLDPARLASVVAAVMDGLQVQWLLDETFDMLAAFDTFLQAFGDQLRR